MQLSSVHAARRSNNSHSDFLFEVFGKVHLADTFSGIVGCHLSHVVFYHQLYKLLEGGGLRVPSSTGSPASEFLGFVRFLSLPGS